MQLKESGEMYLETIYVLSKLFVMLGVNPETAAADACKMEHIISDETFAALKNHLENHMQ